MAGKQLKSIIKSLGRRGCLGAVALLAALAGSPAGAVTYVLPNQDDVIGQVQYARVQAGDTLPKLARRYDVGIARLKTANPDIDPTQLQQGQRLLIPSRFILPRGARRGIVINLAEQRLYHYTHPPEGPALVSTYPISVGPEGRARTGHFTIAKRLRKPSWNVPGSSRMVPPGPDNPLGEYGMLLDGGNYMIHSTNRPYSIGMPVNQGSIRLYPEDMAVLIHRTNTETPVRIINAPFKYGYKLGKLYFEIHKPAGTTGRLNLAALVNKVTAIIPSTLWSADWQRIRSTGERASGIATPVAQLRSQAAQPRRWQLQLATFKDYAHARKLMLQLEELGVPVTTEGCEGDKCRVLAGPFRDTAYMKDLAKRIRWITRIKSITRRYEPQADSLAAVGQTMAMSD